jgi:hypothetical protein
MDDLSNLETHDSLRDEHTVNGVGEETTSSTAPGRGIGEDCDPLLNPD